MTDSLPSPSNRFARDLGVRVLERRADGATITLDLAERHLNAADMAHGGAIAALLDIVLSMAAAAHAPGTERRFSITLSMNVNYIAAARVGPLKATGRKVGGGRSTVFCEASVEDGDGRLVATAQATLKLVAPPD